MLSAAASLDYEQETITFTLQQFYQLILSLKQATDDSLGLLVGRRLLVNTHGSLATVVMNCGSIRQFIDVLADFLPLRTNLACIDRFVDGERLCMQLKTTQPLGDIEQMVVEAVMVAIKNIFDYITIGEERGVQAAFTFTAGKRATLAQRIFLCELHYEQSWSGFAFPLSEADAPLPVRDKNTFEQAAQVCRQELEQLSDHLPLHKKIEYLMVNQPNELFNFSRVANILNLSERTLSRLLEKENKRFNEILDQVKYQKAQEYLSAGLNMKQTGILLGYQHSSNFSRALSRWKKQQQ